MRQKIIAGNWKMNGSKESVATLLAEIKQHVGALDNAAEIIVFPSYVFLSQVEQVLKNSVIKWGAQNLSRFTQGAYTGEISAKMLLDFGCQYVLVGHSERRNLYAEDNQIVAEKFARARRAALTPVLCVGETLAQRESGKTKEVVCKQIQAVLDLEEGVDGLRDALVAYEPVWAIGTGVHATPEQAQEVHAAIREFIASEDADLATRLPILYGGSVKKSNATALFAMPDVDGGLIGGASLEAHEFMGIAQCIK